MTPENKKKYEEKKKRVYDALNLREPDRVPATPSASIFPILNAGYTVAEVVYDASMEKMKNALIKYVNEYDPDCNPGLCNVLPGEGPGLELSQPTTNRWAGMPGNIIDENSIQQHIEFPMLLDDEFEEYEKDRLGWTLRKQLPRSSKLLEPLAAIASGRMMGVTGVANVFSTPEFKSMIKDLWAISDFYADHNKRAAAVVAAVEEEGFPMFQGGMAGAPFDSYSNGMRGTILSLSDLYDNEEFVLARVEENYENAVNMIRAGKGHNDGAFVFMPLHKGMDGFMSAEHYEKFYWKYLRGVIYEIIDAGKTPYVYTEGKYNTRLDFLKEVPKGKVIYHFEDVDMAVAKKKLGDIACITGGFPTWKLAWCSKEEIVDEVKRLIDTCAPGGGYIFECSAGLDNCKPENVHAMFETVREYGKY